MDERKIDRDEGGAIELSRLLVELLELLRRFFWVPIVMAAVFAGLLLFRAWRGYTPMYESEATFTIQVVDGGGSDLPGSYDYYDKATAGQLGKTFPYLIQSELMYKKLCRAMGVASIDGTITAQTVENTNLFTIRVRSRDPEKAKEILEKVIRIYPQIADYVIGNTGMNLLTEPQKAETPYNPFRPERSAVKGAAIGALLGLALLCMCAAARKAVRTAEDVRIKLNQPCLAAIPMVALKHRELSARQSLLISNRRLSGAFQESVRGLRIKLLKALPDDGKCKTLLVTGTMPGEGKTTVAINLALSLSQNGTQVVLVDLDMRKPSIKRALGITERSRSELELLQLGDTSLKLLAGDKTAGGLRRMDPKQLDNTLEKLRGVSDYIILDTPPCGLLADSCNVAHNADYAIYVVGSGMAKTSHILDGMQFLSDSGTSIVGCVLNGVNRSGGGYGYGYGYGYRYGYGYGYRSAYRREKG